MGRAIALLGVGLAMLAAPAVGGEKSGIAIDKEKKTVTISCRVAPRKLPNLAQVYPLEVVACWPAPKGQKAHETVVVFDVKPSEVHKALESLGVKAGKPGLGERSTATGPELKISLEIPGEDGKGKIVPIEETMIDLNTNKPLQPLKWLFTGSAMKSPDPEKDDMIYGADLSGTLITIFPVTDDTVIQTSLAAKDEKNWKLELNKALLPKEGSAVKLIIQVK